jgi:hypothetical protein
MYDLPVNEYIPFEYPSIEEYIPEPAQKYQGFQWNPVPTILAPNMAKGEYNMKLARDAFQLEIMPVEMSHD